MKKVFVFLICFTCILIQDTKILEAAQYIDNIDKSEKTQNKDFLVTNYIHNLNNLLNSANRSDNEHKIKEELYRFTVSSELHTNEVIQFFKDNRDRLLKFIDANFLGRLIQFYNKLDLPKIFLNKENINSVSGGKTLLMQAISFVLESKIEKIELIIKIGADINQITSTSDYCCQTALGMLIIEEIEIRENEKWPGWLNLRLKTIEKIANILFNAGADICSGGKIIKDHWLTKRYINLNIENDVDLIDLINEPLCKTVFDTYKKRVSQAMMDVQQIAFLPPGLLPIMLSYV